MRSVALPRTAATLALLGAFALGCSNASAWGAGEPSRNPLPGAHPTPLVELPSTVVVGGNPCGIAEASGKVWVSDLGGDRVARIDAQTRAPLGTFPVGSAPCWLVAGPDVIWVSPTEEGFLQALDPVTGQVIDTVEISQGPSDAKLVMGWGDVWATSTPDGDVVRIDGETRQIEARVDVGLDPRGLFVGGGLVWVAVEGSNRVVAIDPSANTIVRRFRVRSPSAIVAATKKVVWVGQLAAERVTKLRATDGSVEGVHDLAANPQPGAIVEGEVWSPDHLGQDVLRFSGSGEIVRTAVGRYPSALVRAGDHVWVANFGDGTVSVVDVDAP